MPIEVPMMPASASGVSITRSAPNSSCRPLVARNTPPNLPTSSPSTTTRGSSRIWVCSALRTASMMFIVGIGSSVMVRVLGPRLGQEVRALLGEVPRQRLVDVVEDRVDRRRRERIGAGERVGDRLVVALRRLGVERVGPQPAGLQVAAQALDRILALPHLG